MWKPRGYDIAMGFLFCIYILTLEVPMLGTYPILPLGVLCMVRFFKKAAGFIGMASGAAVVLGLTFIAGSGEKLVDMWLIQYLAAMGYISMLGVYIGFDEIFGEGQ